MKIIISGDWHLGAIVGGWDMHDDIIRVAKRIIEATYTADLFVLGGDLFHHPRPTPRAYAAAIELLEAVGCPFVVIPGNHEAGKGFIKIKDGGSIPVPDAIEPLRRITFRSEARFPDGPTSINLDTGQFYFIGHISDALARYKSEGMLSAQKYIDSIFEQARKDRPKAIFTHLNVQGARGGSEETFLIGGDLQMPLAIAKDIPCPIFNSHIHKKQEMPPNIYMPGSIIPTDFGDRDGNKGYMVWEL